MYKRQGLDCWEQGFGQLKRWTLETKELSAASLKEWMDQGEGESWEYCRKAYQWTLLVNQMIEQMPKDGSPAFAGVKDALEKIHGKANIAVVSSRFV